eukprot:TRINITY_DN7979_c0_g1_i1.p1 TRINITY_DN7979_c0_g1~~TRINITY_DN7979_c0_g1_i1.p1  ORF type:complete len:1780 (-),score=249.14 TRINITY_DN7979_c0_g1_i1:253-5007(-)
MPCLWVNLLNATTISCTLPSPPAGFEGWTSIRVTSNQISSSSFPFEYVKVPSIAAYFPSIVALNALLQISGVGLGRPADISQIEVRLIPTLGPYELCIPTQISSNGTDLTCRTPSVLQTSSSSFSVQVRFFGVGTLPLAGLTVSLNYNLISIYPSPVTAGGSVRLTAQTFGASINELMIFVDGLECKNATLTASATPPHVDCVISPMASTGGRPLSFVNTALGLSVFNSSVAIVSEREILVLLYTNLGGSSWLRRDGWLSASSHCTWRGVLCNPDGLVTSIALSSNNLAGPITPRIGELFFLQSLILYNNTVGGTIPETLCSLKKLEIVDLHSNLMNGSIPACVGSLLTLTRLSLSRNALGSFIPASLGQLGALVDLELAHNQLKGSIPSDLALLPNLKTIDVSFNMLTGSVPAQLGRTSALTRVQIQVNMLTGSVPIELCYVSGAEFGCNFFSNICFQVQSSCFFTDCNVASPPINCKNNCEPSGYIISALGQGCVETCGIFVPVRVGSHAVQCQALINCTAGCSSCAGPGLEVSYTGCTTCDQSQNYLLSLDGKVCTPLCGPNQIRNTNARIHQCVCDFSNNWFPNSNSSECVQCAPDQYFDYELNRCRNCFEDCASCVGPNPTDCLSCPFAVQFQVNGASGVCTGSCGSCISGFAEYQSACVCPPGATFQSGTCVACQPDTYAPFYGLDTACLSCGPNRGTGGLSGRGNATDCVCLPSFEEDPATGACVCPPGSKFVATAGSCFVCPENTYESSYSLSEVCPSCPASTNTNGRTGSTQPSDCQCRDTFAFNPSSSICECPPGWFENTQGLCEPCPASTYKTIYGPFQSVNLACAACPLHSGTALSGQSNVTACICTAASGFQADPHSGNCVCPPGRRYDQVSDSCVLCPANTYQDSYDLSESCQSCASRTDTAGLVGQVSVTNCTCQESYTIDPNTTTCQCRPGYFEESNRCNPCPVDTFKTIFGPFESAGIFCQVCPPNSGTGLRTAQTAESICSCFLGFDRFEGRCECPPGWFENHDGLCEPCPTGTYKDVWGASHSVSEQCASCAAGLTTAGSGADNKTDCDCAPGFFRENNDKSSPCIRCPRGLTCLGAAAVRNISESAAVGDFSLYAGLLVEPEYWYTQEPSYLPKDGKSGYLLLKCPKDGVCLGVNGCAEGYQGPLCGACADRFSMFAGDCLKCPPPGLSLLLFLFLLVGVGCFSWVLIRLAVENVEAGAGMFLKIIVNHAQILIFVGQFGVDWPTLLRRFFNFPESAATVSIFSNSLSARCGFGWEFFDLFLLRLLQPLFIVGILWLCYYVPAIYRKQAKGLAVLNRWLQACLVLLYFVHPSQVNTVLSLFTCTSVGERRFLVKDMNVDCESGEYRGWVGFASLYLTFYCFASLGLLGYVLYSNRDQFHRMDSVVRARYQYLLTGYNHSMPYFYLWDIWITLRKMMFVIFATFFPGSLQIFFSVILLYLTYVATKQFHPLQKEEHQSIETISLHLLIFTSLTGLLYHTDAFQSTDGGGVAVAVVIMLVNLAFLCRVLYLVAVTVAHDQGKKIEKVRSRISEATSALSVAMHPISRRPSAQPQPPPEIRLEPAPI